MVSSPLANVLMCAANSLKRSSATISLSFLIAIALWAPSFAANRALSKSSMTAFMVVRGTGRLEKRLVSASYLDIFL